MRVVSDKFGIFEASPV